MRKLILLLLLLFIPLVALAQSTIDGYKYVVVPDLTYEKLSNDYHGLSEEIRKLFRKYRVIPIDLSNMRDFRSKKNPCELLRAIINHASNGTYRSTVTIKLLNCLNIVVFSKSATAGNSQSNVSRDLYTATRKIFDKEFEMYKFNSALTPKLPEYKYDNDLGFDINSEGSIREYFDENGAELIEGIWEFNTPNDPAEYKLLIIKDDYKFKAIIIESNDMWFPGEEKATFETSSSDEIVTVKWTMGDKIGVSKTIAKVTNNALMEFVLKHPQAKTNNNDKTMLYKVYPKFDENNKKERTKTGKWEGNGSGIIISKSGHIITNHHVIEDADDIEVEFILNDEVQKFNAEIVQVDKVNDLAIIKIFDINFDGVDELPYNFKTRSSDVGTKVYAFGYPLALSIMGKEIKVTDGMISAKTGFGWEYHDLSNHSSNSRRK